MSEVKKIDLNEEVERFIQQGVEDLRCNRHKKAEFTLGQALALSQEVALPRIIGLYKHYLRLERYNSAVTLGTILLSVRKQDYKFATKLGNIARKANDFHRAEKLYRKALKINAGYKSARNNLAACLAHVGVYDEEIDVYIERYIPWDNFLLPDYKGNPNIIKKITSDLKRKEGLNRKIQDEKDKERSEPSKGIKFQASSNDYEPSYQEICAVLQLQIKENWRNKSISESYKTIQLDTYNLGLYTLSQKDSELTIECMQKLKQQRCSIEYLEMLIALAWYFQGKVKDAIELLETLRGYNPRDRFLNINLGLIYRKEGNELKGKKYLLLGAEKLKAAGGLYRYSDLVKRGEEFFTRGIHEKALKLFKVATSWADDIDVWEKIGKIFSIQNKHHDRVKAYEEIVRIDPGAEIAQQKAMEIHDFYSENGDRFVKENNFQQGANYYEQALGVKRQPETIKKAIKVYTKLKNFRVVSKLNRELETLERSEIEQIREKERQRLISLGKQLLKYKDYEAAINTLDEAFNMKLDKDVFSTLAGIYKSLNHTRAMQRLLKNWDRMKKVDLHTKTL